MLVVPAADVERLLTIERCVPAMRAAMAQVSRREVVLPLRQFMGVPDTAGKLGLMPGYIADPPLFGVKVVSKFPRAAGDPHGSHVGAVMLFDARDGLALALIEGGSLTAIRTAAASALATDLLAKPDARTLAVLGTGEQARRHVEAVRLVRPIERAIVWGRDPGRTRAFADAVGAEPAASVEAAVAAADVVCTTTSAAEPILAGRWLKPGAHVNLVGSAIPTTAEADVDLVARAAFFVDYREAALAQAGELRRAIETGAVGEDHVRAEIGDVLLGRATGRRGDEITVYKSLGVTAQDLAAGHVVWRAAAAAGLGTEVEL